MQLLGVRCPSLSRILTGRCFLPARSKAVKAISLCMCMCPASSGPLPRPIDSSLCRVFRFVSSTAVKTICLHTSSAFCRNAAMLRRQFLCVPAYSKAVQAISLCVHVSCVFWASLVRLINLSLCKILCFRSSNAVKTNLFPV